MVKYLIHRPVSVIMVFLASFIVGCIIYATLPTSLLPNMDIPRMTVEIDGDNLSARELESSRMRPVRRAVMQVRGLEELRSETRDGKGIITLSFEYGTNTDLAFIEVNEKIETSLNSLPKEAPRPKVIKASATDIPVFYLNMCLKGDNGSYNDLCGVAENTVRRRLEQLPQVAMVDITGLAKRVIKVVPDENKLQANNLTHSVIEDAIVSSNAEPGSMLVRDGYYEYSIRVGSQLNTVKDVEDIYIRHGERMLQLKDVCEVSIGEQTERGLSFVDGKRAVTMGIIKQNDDNMDDLKAGIDSTMHHFENEFPQIEFKINRNQTELLESTISNLEQNFVLGFILILITTILFIGRFRLSVVIGLSMIVSVVITFLLFGLCKISLNIISISGLILAVGMMIDNSIIVTENITQHMERGKLRNRAIAAGASEMIAPLLSSSLTTVAVFVPLIFLSGIAGEMFFDQAFSITAGLGVSYLTGIILLPVLYLLTIKGGRQETSLLNRMADKISLGSQSLYERGANFAFRHKTAMVMCVLLSLPLCVLFSMILDKEVLPQTDQHETEMKIDWNEDIGLEENRKRTLGVLRQTDNLTNEHAAFIGLQDFSVDQNVNRSISESFCYLNTDSPEALNSLRDTISKIMDKTYPNAIVSFSPPMTVIEKMFDTRQSELEVHITAKERAGEMNVSDIEELRLRMEKAGAGKISKQAVLRQYVLKKHYDRMTLYNIRSATVDSVLQRAMQDRIITTLHASQDNIPVTMPKSDKPLHEILDESLIPSGTGALPLSVFISAIPTEERKDIVAGRDGNYIPLSIKSPNVEKSIQIIKEIVDQDGRMDASFTGSWFGSRRMVGELLVVLAVSLILMYFILCSQFENFVSPLIILLEIPIDAAFAFAGLWLSGQSLNLMSVIGIIVSCGVVINDSILKIDSINVLRKQGMPLLEAIHTAGKRRVRAILMTSLTTVFAMLPVLFATDIGSELQRPLVIAMTTAMIFGTLASLFVVPLFYWIVYRHESKK